MSLTAGTQIGPYQVVGLIGQGGMGEVYRAKDTKLGRDVALKVLPDLFAADPERLARFQREARVLASLNHPNIASIYGLEEAEGVRALVLELVEGPTLAERIAQGAIPVEEALPVARQIADALEAAHERGVIHRDLKPANVKVKADGMVKVLDFGLAKALEGDAGSDPSESPTLTAAATRAGVIMGTAAYMSPEQARGKTVDKRADIWAFGVVLYEMLTGQRPFKGRDVSEGLAAAMMKEPDWPALPANLPAPLGRLLRRCLVKEPGDRLRDVGDARAELRDVLDAPPTTNAGGIPAVPVAQPARWRQALPWVAGLLLAVITGLAVWTLTRPPAAPAASPSRFTVVPPPGVQLTGNVRLSSDGRTLIFNGVRDGLSQVYLRPLDQLEALPVRGTEGTFMLGRSPDGQWLLVADAGTMKRVPLTGGPATPFAEGVLGPAAWGPDDDTVVLGAGDGLRLIRASGGETTLLTTLAQGESGHRVPTFLPNGRAVLFSTAIGGGLTGQVAVYDFETGQRTNLLPGTSPRFATTGHLIFWREGSLWAVPFDPDRLAVEGAPVVVVDGVATTVRSANFGAYTLADNGTLVYLPGDVTPTRTLGWVNREGMMTTPLVESAGLEAPQLSPAGTHVAFARASDTGDLDIVVWDVARGSETRLTESAANDSNPLWTPDGAAVTFVSNADDVTRFDLYVRSVDLSAEAQHLLETPSQAEQPGLYFSVPGSWSPDGQTLLYTASVPGHRDIWRLPVGGEPEAFLDTQFNERGPRLSPNGNWLAYVSNQAGEDRIHVTAFPDGGQVFPVSTGPGTEAVWSRDGRELFYRNGNQLWVVEVETEDGFTAERPTLLFEGPYMTEPYAGDGVPNYDVSLDGQQFLMVRSAEAAETPGFVVVENWFEELKARVPVD